ncbi:MAG TPA: site-specific DNA-methyltransferase [Blastocatellia bacterium]|nr:site-specific DNA-methyltransferase [Blastocatellia bacterium]
MGEQEKNLAPRNRTITLTENEAARYKQRLLTIQEPTPLDSILDRTICQDTFQVLRCLPSSSIDLLFADPPYNLTKTFNENRFQRTSLGEYELWLDSWLSRIVRLLKPTASIYLCGDWRSSAAIHRIGAKYFQVQNRITWEREKGRGARSNWKNCSEDIWFFTRSDSFTFNVDAVKLKRQVIAPYTSEDGRPKDWDDSEEGRFRLTHPSNLWTDITVPFWSMPENTDHPTQKPEKLLAKIILASSNEGDVVFDPFLGSGTTSVVAKKLNRHFIGLEIDEKFCCIAEKRLEMADMNKEIQGYHNGVFWERNTLASQGKKKSTQTKAAGSQYSLL